VRERTAELRHTRLEIIKRLGRAGEFRDNETGMHVVRVAHYCRLLGEAVRMNEEDLDLLFNAAPMHDIGKIGIRDNVLLKPGKLDDDEIKLMRQHVPFGSEIIGEHTDGLLAMARLIALTHHEKWDGTGYHRGLKGAEIPLVGRITSIADVFDALTSVRPYKKAWPVEDAVTLIKREAGTSFDPELVQKFVAILPRILEIREKYSDAPSIGHCLGGEHHESRQTAGALVGRAARGLLRSRRHPRPATARHRGARQVRR